MFVELHYQKSVVLADHHNARRRRGHSAAGAPRPVPRADVDESLRPLPSRLLPATLFQRSKTGRQVLSRQFMLIQGSFGGQYPERRLISADRLLKMRRAALTLAEPATPAPKEWPKRKRCSDQHSEMAKRLHERASETAEPAKAKKLAAMASVFRRLAARAESAKSG
jgi:hypothetical protein